MEPKCKCGSNRIMAVSAKCSDMFSCSQGGREYQGYVLSGIGIGGGDFVEFKFCLECGQIQGEFPVEESMAELIECQYE